MIKALFDRWLTAILLIIAGVVGWYYAAGFFGDVYATALGPDKLVGIFFALLKLGVAVLMTRYVVRWRFPTVHFFTKTDKELGMSRFTQAFTQKPYDPRIWMGIAVHLGVFLGICLLLSSL